MSFYKILYIKKEVIYVLCSNFKNSEILKELFFGTNGANTLSDNAILVQVERTSYGPAALVKIESRYFFYLKTPSLEIIKREVDSDDVFAMARIAEWAIATTKLSKRKQKMRIPKLCVMRAVGTRADDIDLFLDNESKNGLSAKLRQMEWYKNAHHEIKTAALKLFAHLGLFEQQKIELRMKIVDKVILYFTPLEIHNLFGGLSPGIKLTNILKGLDVANAIDSEIRKRFDPNGQKAIQFFLKNMDQDDFKSVACYALTHYLPEIRAYNLQKRTSVMAFESMAAVSSNQEISSIANMINAEHNRIVEMLHERAGRNVGGSQIACKQAEIETLRSELRKRVVESRDFNLLESLQKVKEAERPFSVDFIKKRLSEDVCFTRDIPPEMALSAKNAGYRSSDEPEIRKLCEIYRLANAHSKKLFDLSVVDEANDIYRYAWLKPDDPRLYTLSMLCGGTCMRPNYAGEAALWEAALSEDVAVCAILDHEERVVAYFRVNYDQDNCGFYIDTVESRFSYVLNNEDIWRVIKRAVKDMSLFMNRKGVSVKVVTFREERGNRLKTQWNRLPASLVFLKAKIYQHPKAPWPYGDDKPRIQKEVWRQIGTGSLRDDSYRRISVERNSVISKGATGAVYVLDDRRIMKVFPADYAMSKILDEFNKARLFYNYNLPSPYCHEIAYTNDCFGLVFDRVYGISLTEAVLREPQKLNHYVKKMIQLLKKIHAIDVTGSGLDSVKHQYLEYLYECRNYYTNSDYKDLQKLIMSIPDRCMLLHGDFHSENIMVDSNDELVMIDFAGVGYGHPIFDLMAEGAVMPVTLENSSQIVENYLGATADWIRKFWDSYIDCYLGELCDVAVKRDIVLMSRLRNAVTAAITNGIPEDYLRLCAKNTHHILIPEISRLIKRDWNVLE